MPKFSGKQKVTTNLTAPVATVSDEPDTLTAEGGAGWTRDAKSELFLLAITNMVGEDTFYESAEKRDKRFSDLARKVAKSDPDWVARFIPYLRNQMNMRSASVVMAVEAALALSGSDKAVNLRSMIDNACARADEPAEILGYYLTRYAKGKKLATSIKRGVSDAVLRLYNERNALKYDSQTNDIRMGDVIQLVHPEPTEKWQGNVFKYLLDRRYSAEWPEGGYEGLSVINKTHEIDAIPVEERRAALLDGKVDFEGTGFTWERVSGWINGPMDAAVWEKIIPHMGYMALLRNLRNFEQAQISKESVEYVRKVLTDPDAVAKSRQFPFRFVSAYNNTNSMLWKEALEEAVNLSCRNVPTFTGKTLVLGDVSGSMSGYLSAKSKVETRKVAAILAAAISYNSEVDLVAFATTSLAIKIPKAQAVLKTADLIEKAYYKCGGGTNTFEALRKHYDPAKHRRIVIVSDMQAFPDGTSRYGGNAALSGNLDFVKCPIYNFNVAGYAATHMKVGEKGRYEFGGFNDQAFKAIELLESKKSADWPF